MAPGADVAYQPGEHTQWSAAVSQTWPWVVSQERARTQACDRQRVPSQKRGAPPVP